MPDTRIKELFASDIYRRIEEVIKVDQTDEQIIRAEIDEYVATDSIRGHYKEILRRYWEMPKKPGEDVGVWVSGFFGSGKSSFAKMLGLALQNRSILGQGAAKVFGQRTGDTEIQVLLQQIGEQIPTDAVIFDVSTDRGIKSGSQNLTEIMYRLFLKNLGYASDLDLANLETTLEQKGELDSFKKTYQELFQQEWDANKDLIAFSLGEASAVMHRLYPERFPAEDTWVAALQNRSDVSPGKLAERCAELMGRRRPGKHLVFVIDEVGQFVARDVQKMLDLMGVVQSLGRVGRGKMWIIVTSQEKLTELVGGLEGRQVELARLMDRFPLQVHLEPSDISEVTGKRVLAKNSAAETILRDRYKDHSGRMASHTKLSAEIQLPELTSERFIDLYPLLPYQIDLIIQVVSGLRLQGGASKHVGGANRTIIKLAQQLLVHEAAGLAEQPVGRLARIDQIYDLVSGNIPSEIRGKIAEIRSQIPHPFAQPVAKAICLLQYVQSIHRTAENIAAALHPAVDADSALPEVKEALQKLLDGHKVRLADGQYRIPTPAEDDWETTRANTQPKPGDVNRLHTKIMTSLWEPRPSCNLLDVKAFKGGLVLNGRPVPGAEGDIDFHLTLAEPGPDYQQRVTEARTRSQAERRNVFWVAALNDAIDRETVEVYRSEEILSRKERSAKTKTENALVTEEKLRQRTHEMELRRLLREAVLNGEIFFRGNDRSPDENAGGMGQAASKVLSQVLPDVFDRFAEGAAKASAKDLDALLTNENLRGLPPVFTELGLLKDQGGQPVFVTDAGPLKEVLARIENKTSYGETATGKYLEQEFAKEPFGWTLDVVRLFAVSLLRAGTVKATSKGLVLDSALSTEARNTFPQNNLFRAVSFQKKQSGTTIEDWLAAEVAYREMFGKQLPELEASAIAATLRKEITQAEERVREAHDLLLKHRLPGEVSLHEALDQMRAIRTAGEDDTILTFNGTYRALKEAHKRSADLTSALTEPRLHDLARARTARSTIWPFLDKENGLPEGLRDKAEALADLLEKETFYRELPSIEQHTTALEEEYRRRFQQAVEARSNAYRDAYDTLRATDGWLELSEEQQARVAEALITRGQTDVPPSTSIPFLRSELSACPQHLKRAIQEMLEILDGNRLVTLSASEFFGSRVETQEQLDAAIVALRQRVGKLLGEGKKVLVQ